MDVKSRWNPPWHRMDHVSWSIVQFSKTTSLEVGLTKAGRPWHSHCSPPLIYSILSCVRTPENSIEMTFSRGSGHICFTFHLEGPWPHYMILEVSWDSLDTFFWALTISWSRLLARVWSGPDSHRTWRRPLFVPGCRCRSRNDWPCSY